MSNTNTGGPAFPSGTDFYGGPNKEYGKRGLTLRDYFAAKAMQGWMANPTATPVEAGVDDADPQALADVAAAFGYMVADAMMKARQP